MEWASQRISCWRVFMKALNVLLSTLLLSSLAAAPVALSKEGKKAGKAAMKECTDKGGQWDKKKKTCSVTETPSQADAPAPTETSPTPAPTTGETSAPTK